ncbi:hypothetical protein M5C90_25735 [Pseudomonas chlororaphis subsp. piscium]|nr:hypothetical protein M5C90_25735 [Pseudomonas chlororaphis subsp. piscium]
MIDRYILSSRDQRRSEQEKAQVTCVFLNNCFTPIMAIIVMVNLGSGCEKPSNHL